MGEDGLFLPDQNKSSSPPGSPSSSSALPPKSDSGLSSMDWIPFSDVRKIDLVEGGDDSSASTSGVDLGNIPSSPTATSVKNQKHIKIDYVLNKVITKETKCCLIFTIVLEKFNTLSFIC